jgi:hypothetical protein
LNTSRLDRLAPLSGVLAVTGLLAASALLGVYDYLPTGQRLAQAFSHSPSNVVASGFIGNLSGLLMMAFAACTSVRLRQAEPPGGWLAKLGYGGGTAAGIVLGIGFSTIIATGSRAGSAGGLDPVEAITLYDFYSNLLGELLGVALAAFMISASIVWLRGRLLPGWFNWLAILVGLLSLSPVAYLALILDLTWVAVVSVWLYRSQPLTG